MEQSIGRIVKSRATVVARLLPTAFLCGCMACDARQTDVALPDTTVVVVHAKAEWYIAADAPEQRWTGSLRERTSVVGPNTRSGLRFQLLAEQGVLLVYDPREDSPLNLFTGDEVEVVGKLVDLSTEGFGEELWIGSIRRLP